MTKTLISNEVAEIEGSLTTDKRNIADTVEKLCATIREFEALLAKLTEKLRLCEPAIINAFGMEFIHGHQYTGPTYGREMEAAEAFLRRFRGEE